MSRLQIYQPIPSLRETVAFFWAIESAPGEARRQTVRILPDGLPGFVLQHNNGKSVYREAERFLPVSFLYGQATGPCLNDSVDYASVMGICFQPGALAALTGLPAAALTNQTIPSTEVISPIVEAQLLEAKTVADQITLLTSVFLKRMAQGATPDPLIARSVAHLRATQGKLPVTDLHRTYGLSERQFQRRFKAKLGLCPYQYARIIRFQAAIRYLHGEQRQSQAGLAYELGYADQSHFIRDFRTYSGLTPKQYQNHPARALAATSPATGPIGQFPVRLLAGG